MIFKRYAVKTFTSIVLGVTLLGCGSGEAKNSGLGPPPPPPPSPSAPVAEANGPYAGTVGSPVQLSSDGSSAAANPWTAVWSFGDGQTASGTTLQHVYGSPGTYTLVLTVTDADGFTAIDSSIVTVISPPPPPNPGHPNEPAGFTRFYENAYTVAPAEGVGNDNGAAIDGCAWKIGGNISVSSDGTAPSGDGSVLDLLFPTGMPSGVGPGIVQEWDTCAESSNTEYSKVYVDMWIKMAGGPNGDLFNWEQHPVATKFTGFWGSGRNNQGANASDMYGNIWNSGGPLFQTDWAFTWTLSHFPPGARLMTQNINTSMKIRAGQWHRIEILMEMNSVPGFPDGVFRWWLDGTLTMNYSDVTYNSPASPSGFYGRHNSPTWGGQAVNPKTRDDHIYYDNMYMSAMP